MSSCFPHLHLWLFVLGVLIMLYLAILYDVSSLSLIICLSIKVDLLLGLIVWTSGLML